MAFVVAKCTECGGQLEVEQSKKAANCQYCGNAFIVQEAINNYNTTINIQDSGLTAVHLLEHAENLMIVRSFPEASEVLDRALERGGARNHKVHWYKFLCDMEMTPTDTWEDKFTRDMFDEEILNISSHEFTEYLCDPHFNNARRYAADTAEEWLNKQYNSLIDKFDEIQNEIRQEQEKNLALLNKIYDYVSQKEVLENSIESEKLSIRMTPTSFDEIRERRLNSGFPEVMRLILCFLASIVVVFLTGVVFTGFDVSETLRQTIGSPIDTLILMPLFIFIPVRLILFLYHCTWYTISVRAKGRRKIKVYRRILHEEEENLAKLNKKYSPTIAIINENSLQKHQSTEAIKNMIECIKQNRATTIQDAIRLL